MRTIFLSFSFKVDRDLASDIETLIVSHGLNAVTGRRLGGEELTPEVKKKIEAADALVAIMSRREELANGGWTTSNWVRDELNYARAQGKRAIALVEEGIDTSGMGAAHERLALDRADPARCLLDLSETIGIWKSEAGRKLRVQLLPDDAADLARRDNGIIHCRYRLHQKGEFGAWTDCQPVPGVGGTFLFIDGVRDEDEVQVEVKGPDQHWISRVTTQAVNVDLELIGN